MPNKSSLWRALLLAATLLTILIIIYIGGIALWLFNISQYPRHNFTKEAWSTNQEKRYEISQNIIDSDLLIGQTKSEIRQLLGDEGNTDSSDHWTYYLGFRPGFINIDPDVLEIKFENGKVTTVTQRET